MVLAELCGSFGGTLMVTTVFGGLQGAAPRDKIAQVMAVSQTGLQVAHLVGVGLGGFLATQWGLRTSLQGAAALLVLVLVPQLLRWWAAGWQIDAKAIR